MGVYPCQEKREVEQKAFFRFVITTETGSGGWNFAFFEQ
jgi:hypothetical protein